VALARGGELLFSVSGDAAASHSTDLLESVEIGLQRAGQKLSDVELFAAARGPGSFTGLRIGLATIKSFAMCAGKSCVGVSTLAAIAHAAGESDNTIALLPAGRGEVFAQSFSVRDGQARELDSAAHLKPEEVLARYGAIPELIWAGEGAHLYPQLLRDSARGRGFAFNERSSATADGAREGWTLARPESQLAKSIAALALNSYREGKTIDPGKLQADYVRASDAEINERWQAAK
jgi:tRNA threonylcarbamoyladenosine biosynthesis protein TsaB